MDRDECLAYAAETLSGAPRWPWVEQHEPHGSMVAQFVLPLALCKPPNRTRHAVGWELARDRRMLVHAMSLDLHRHCSHPSMVQEYGPKGCYTRFANPLSGRPQVRAIRFSSVETDSRADWCKTAVDCLIVPRVRRRNGIPTTTMGLGLIADDRPSAIELRAWSEYAPRLRGFVLIEVRSGEQ